MTESGSMRIQADAAIALANWKAFFAERVAEKARELAIAGNSPELITISHYRQAAVLAANALAVEVGNIGSNDDLKAAA